jgi:hypothetical protein
VNNFEQLPKARMNMNPANATGPKKDRLFSSVPPPSIPPTDAVLPSYFAVNFQIFRESLLPTTSRGNAAELHLASQFLPPPLARRVV